MKIRTDFVTNSSSSSFIIAKSLLSASELFLIRGLNEYLKEKYFIQGPEIWENPKYNFDDIWCGDYYTIVEDDNYIEGHTTMDNGDFEKFIKEAGINPKIIKISSGY